MNIYTVNETEKTYAPFKDTFEFRKQHKSCLQCKDSLKSCRAASNGVQKSHDALIEGLRIFCRIVPHQYRTLLNNGMGQNWNTFNIGFQFRAKGLTTVLDSTSEKFLFGQVMRQSQQPNQGSNATIYLDFASLGRLKCGPIYLVRRAHPCKRHPVTPAANGSPSRVTPSPSLIQYLGHHPPLFRSIGVTLPYPGVTPSPSLI
ncbi:uncharacterized protein F5147DRAFT_790752 [Suillus discolor]|uniref:Uncharacterized protein n=1 Tax=Suillus discolor TaxID=1912936 RepID=A0A9P7ERS7_9AGAM|nr:uncharacterized protein F5147DRAFT_790752 [Suillus discolor]KAG2087359.1 hypothetical protein F5147DRAFT_790752 [Suillus discolor]